MGATGDEFLRRIVALVESGFGLLEGEVFGLTGIMIALTFGILGLKFMLAGEEAKAILAQFFFTLLFVGVMTWVIKAWPTLYKDIGTYFQDLGGVAGGVNDAGEMLQRPSRVLDSLDLAKAPIENAIDQLSGGVMGGWGIWNSGKTISLSFALFFIEIAFFVVYLNLFFTVVEFHAVSLAAWPFLAFSVFKGSAFLAERPLGYVFAIGAKLFIMMMLLGFSLNFFDKSILPVNPTIGQALDATVMAFLIMVLGLVVPVVAAALISGGPGLAAAIPMMTAAGTLMAMGSAIQTARAAAASSPVRAVGSATATAAQRAGSSFGQSFAGGGAANMAMSAMRGGNATAAAATGASTQRGAGAAAAMRASSGRATPRGSAPRGDFLQRVRNAIPPGTDGQASGSAPRLSDGS